MSAKDEGERALEDARACSRVSYNKRAIVAPIPDGPMDAYQDDVVLPVSTRDISDGGARIAGSPLLQVGQGALLRSGSDSGLMMSSYGKVVRKARGTQAPTNCEWGIQFRDNESDTLRKHQIFSPAFQRALEVNSKLAVIVASDRLELFWWLGQLSKRVQRVFVSSECPDTLAKLRERAQGKRIHSLASAPPSGERPLKIVA